MNTVCTNSGNGVANTWTIGYLAAFCELGWWARLASAGPDAHEDMQTKRDNYSRLVVPPVASDSVAVKVSVILGRLNRQLGKLKEEAVREADLNWIGAQNIHNQLERIAYSFMQQIEVQRQPNGELPATGAIDRLMTRSEQLGRLQARIAKVLWSSLTEETARQAGSVPERTGRIAVLIRVNRRPERPKDTRIFRARFRKCAAIIGHFATRM